ncbi:MAG: 50S ribosomal protein L23 [Gammaproteobacteria bacterium]|nr:50S ribosomal protein L23 [Gammaproteobacteria bacterium]MBT8133397.1 50S ribosomal protein L23 [Gammaproteobacteria bacterium]NNJ50400.1 50S ribosomal protein L23 [Gammaproteobacteria bacterium]
MNQERMHQILVSPHVSEKGALLADEHNQHVFKVLSTATKSEVKQAVEGMFKVKVDKVRILNIKGKTKRFGGRIGKRSDLRKAYVTLMPDNDIDFAGAN